jgi:hypothetical protein
MTSSIHGTGKVVIMDSGFCVLDGLLELKRVGVFGSALIKKRRYWAKHINGDEVCDHFKDSPVGHCDARYGVKDGKSFYIYRMKEPDYVMMMMATYGNMDEVANGTAKRTYQQDGRATTRNFRYKTPFYNHFKFRHQVDDHNAKRHAPISIEDCLGARRWDIRQFSFLLAITEVNVKLALEFGKAKDKTSSMLAFRKRLAKALVFNHWFLQEIKDETQVAVASGTRNRRGNHHHDLLRRKPYTGKYNPAIRNFVKTKKRYVRLKCCNCPGKTRYYCRCNPSMLLCKVCFGKHELGS